MTLTDNKSNGPDTITADQSGVLRCHPTLSLTLLSINKIVCINSKINANKIGNSNPK